MASTSVLFLTSCMAMLVALSLAQEPLFFPPSLQVPGGATIQKCAASLVNLGGCYTEIFRAYRGGVRTRLTIGPVCCKAVHDISSKCWSQMFPYNPFFPPLVNNYCARYLSGPHPTHAPAPAPMA